MNLVNDRRRLVSTPESKKPKRRPGNDPNAGNTVPVVYAGTSYAGQLSARSSAAGGTTWTPVFNRSRSR